MFVKHKSVLIHGWSLWAEEIKQYEDLAERNGDLDWFENFLDSYIQWSNNYDNDIAFLGLKLASCDIGEWAIVNRMTSDQFIAFNEEVCKALYNHCPYILEELLRGDPPQTYLVGVIDR